MHYSKVCVCVCEEIYNFYNMPPQFIEKLSRLTPFSIHKLYI
jgi:hypothetical protein